MFEDLTLIPGRPYNVPRLRLIRWTVGDGTSTDGYHLADYFDPLGRYRGPDVHGIAPIVEYEYDPDADAAKDEDARRDERPE